jgi:hypothetical protein
VAGELVVSEPGGPVVEVEALAIMVLPVLPMLLAELGM